MKALILILLFLVMPFSHGDELPPDNNYFYIDGELWVGNARKTEADRKYDAVTPIEKRPNRPFHFYGNAVRRKAAGRNFFPLPRDLMKSIRVYRANKALEFRFEK